MFGNFFFSPPFPTLNTKPPPSPPPFTSLQFFKRTTRVCKVGMHQESMANIALASGFRRMQHSGLGK